MSYRLRRIRGVRALQLGLGGGDRKQEFLMIGVLGLIIVGALAIAIGSMFGGRGGGQTVDEYRFQCQACGHEWSVTPAELEQMEAPPEEMMMMGPDQLMECPECHEHAGMPMRQCLNCEKWYVSPQTKFWIRAYGPSGGEGLPEEEPKDICPHCGTDQVEWRREHR
ncbi:MAG: hypothetical protein ACOC8F_00550 [Planctomycetota bacterium]